MSNRSFGAMGGLRPLILRSVSLIPVGRGGDGRAILPNLVRYGRWPAVPYIGLGEVAPAAAQPGRRLAAVMSVPGSTSHRCTIGSRPAGSP